jgi:uncharacterized protein (DUF1499 family)
MRHAILEDPVSQAAIWSGRIAWFAALVALAGVVLARTGRIEPLQGLGVLIAALLLALLATLVAIFGLSVVWREGYGGAGRAFMALAIAAALFAMPAYLALRWAALPRINDISTDLADPPAFSRSRASLAARGDRLRGEPSLDTRAAQRASYEGLAPITLERSAEEAFEIARNAARSMGWRILEAVPPGGRSGAASIEAVDVTSLLRLPDDITVRIRPLASGARIDMRSASRFGNHDFGVNARRIQAYARAINELNDAK